MRHCIHNNMGLTLIEGLLAVLILSLVVALILPCMLENLDWSRSETTKLTLKNLGNSLRQYRLQHSYFPRTLEDAKRYIASSSWPIKDAWGHKIYYSPTSANDLDFELISYGKDGKRGGQGYNQDLVIYNLKFSTPHCKCIPSNIPSLIQFYTQDRVDCP